jgi:hypothetical protein
MIKVGKQDEEHPVKGWEARAPCPAAVFNKK